MEFEIPSASTCHLSQLEVAALEGLLLLGVTAVVHENPEPVTESPLAKAAENEPEKPASEASTTATVTWNLTPSSSNQSETSSSPNSVTTEASAEVLCVSVVPDPQPPRRYTTSSSSSNKENQETPAIDETEQASTANEKDLVSIGKGTVKIPRSIYRHLNWSNPTIATRKLLTAVFPRNVLATHSLTGKPSPAFPDKPAKKKLDAAKVRDIVDIIVQKCRIPASQVRTSITTKCADEAKMLRTRLKKRKTQ